MDLVLCLLDLTPSSRPTTSHVLRHVWFAPSPILPANLINNTPISTITQQQLLQPVPSSSARTPTTDTATVSLPRRSPSHQQERTATTVNTKTVPPIDLLAPKRAADFTFDTLIGLPEEPPQLVRVTEIANTAYTSPAELTAAVQSSNASALTANTGVGPSESVGSLSTKACQEMEPPTLLKAHKIANASEISLSPQPTLLKAHVKAIASSIVPNYLRCRVQHCHLCP